VRPRAKKAAGATCGRTQLRRRDARKSACLLCCKLVVNVLGTQLEYVVVVIEEVQRPVGTRPYELSAHGLKFGSGRFEDLRCGVKGNVVASPGASDGRGDE